MLSSLLCVAVVFSSVSVQAITAHGAGTGAKTLTLNMKSNVTMYGGSTKTIKVTGVSPKTAPKKAKFKSSAPKVVKVSSKGVMKALKAGKATITVTSASNKKVVKKIKVTVKNIVKNAKGNKVVIKLDGKKTYKLSLAAKYTNLSFSSSKKSVASVDKKGVIKAKKAGTAKITVKGKKGGVKGAKQVISVRVVKKSSQKPTVKPTTKPTTKPVETTKSEQTTTKVNETTKKEDTTTKSDETTSGNEGTTEKGSTEETTIPSTEITSISLNKTEATINYGAAVVLKATILPENATDKTITWTTANKRVATVADTGVVVGSGEGTTTITATTSNGKTATCKVTVVENDIDPLFVVPYVSTYYFNPKPSVNDEIKIPIYMTDSNQSEYLNNDTAGKLDLIYEVDGVEKTIADLPLGDYTLNLGKLTEGTHTFALQTLDKRTGMKSHKLYNELWVINPDTYEIKEAQTYYMKESDLEKYGIHNDNSTDENALITTRDGLTQMFLDLRDAGYRKCVLLPGTYRINGKKARATCISIPSNFTVDMNQSTFKLDTITDDSEGCIVRMDDTYDAHLTNGTLEGDRFERKELGLEKGYQGEPINTLLMRGGKYSSISNLTIKNTTGHTVGTGYVWGPNMTMTEFTKTAIIDGKEVEREGCSTSSYMDLTKIIEWDKDEDYMYVGHGEGYRGVKGNSAIVYVSFYDENKNFLETVTGYQFRKMKIVDGAKYARVTLLGNFPSSYAADSISIFGKHLGDYYEIKNIDYVDTRTTAMAPSACNNLLIEGCTYTRAGNSITPCAID